MITKKSIFSATFLLASTFLSSAASAADVINDFSEFQNAVATGGNYTLNQNITATDTLGTVNGSLSIDGNNFSIEGDNSFNGIEVGANGKLDLKNIGSTETGKGLSGFPYTVKNAGNTVIDNVIFSGNSVSDNTQIWGGVISNTGTLAIKNSVFDGNEASTINSLWGGVIDNGHNQTAKDAYISEISNTVFKNNVAYTLPGSIQAPHGGVIQNSAHIGTIANVTFENNQMYGAENSWGGAHGTALDNNEGGVIDLITDSKFINNKVYRTGDTVYNDDRNYHASAGAIDNYGKIGTIQNSLFEGNSAESVVSSVSGGAIITVYVSENNTGSIDKIDNNIFRNNFAKNEGKKTAQGGAIMLGSGALQELTNNLFEGNYVSTVNANGYGGALGSTAIHKVEGNTFSNNYVLSVNKQAMGGAIYNTTTGNIDIISGNIFTGNYTFSENNVAVGGAIVNFKTIGTVDNNLFENNYTKSTNSSAFGGGIALNSNTGIESITNSDFINNYTHTNSGNAQGGAIYLAKNTEIKAIENNLFEDNHTVSEAGQGSGGAIISTGNIGKIVNSQFKNNYSQAGGNAISIGGAIANAGTIELIENTTFENNYTQSDTVARGGAIYNIGTIGKIVNSSFINNSAIGDETSIGGAIASNTSLNISAQNADVIFSGNKVNDHGNDIYMNGKSGAELELNLSTDNGNIYMDGGVDGVYYNVNINGTGSMYLAAAIENANSVTVDGVELNLIEGKQGQGSIENENGTALTLNNAILNLNNGYQDKLNLKGYSSTGSTLHIDVNPSSMSADTLDINGDVNGTTNVIVHASDNSDIRGKGEILFAQSQNDSTGNENSFALARVYGSPYMYDILYSNLGENSNSWSFAMNDTKNPDYDERLVAPEVLAYIGLHAAGLEQIRDLKQTVFKKSSQKVSGNHNLWIDTSYLTSTTDKPVEFDGDIWGVTAGGNLQYDNNNQLGLFAAYRQGEYDFSGKGNRYYAKSGSQIDIDSYLAGIYYRYNHNGWYGFATIYGGLQKADLNSKDNVVKADSDGNIFSAGIEGGKKYSLNSRFAIEPSLGIYYTVSDFDDIKDNGGKKVKYDTLSQIELEAGIGFEYSFNINGLKSQLYLKPSVIQTITDGDDVAVSQLADTSGYHDQTLGRIELGGRFAITEQISAFGWANYTYGNSYDATSLGLGLNYNF